MEAQLAIRKAKEHVLEMYKEEPIGQIGLEEVKFERFDKVWEITIGFVRDWRSSGIGVLALATPKRTYKVVRIRDEDGMFESLRNWETPEES